MKKEEEVSMSDRIQEFDVKFITKMSKKELKFQRELVKKLRSGEEGAYEDASIYTVLLDLVEGNDAEHIFMMLHNVATDLGQREDIERNFEIAKNWTW